MCLPMLQSLPSFCKIYIRHYFICFSNICVMRVRHKIFYLVTKNAGSFTTSTPTRTWPCSINFVAIGIVWLILLRTITTGSLRLQKQLAVTFWVCDKSHFVEIRPIMYSFSNNKALCSMRKGWSGSISLIFLPNSRISRDSLLYLQSFW